MSFHPITMDTKTWNESGPGRYMESTVTFGGPQNFLRITPGATNKSGLTTCTVTRHLEKDVTLNGVTSRQYAKLVCTFEMSPGLTVNDADLLAANVSEFLSPATLTRILNGER